MALRGKKPTAVQKRAKMLWYGPAGVGKTIAALGFPRPYLIDTEKGAEEKQYVKLLNDAGGAYLFTNDPDTLIEEVVALLSEEHPYRTLIIDPLTPVYNDLLDTWATKLATVDDPTGTSFSRHKGPADRKIKHLLNLLTRLDMNIVVTSHEKAKWSKTSDGKVVETGKTYDAYPKLDYLFDLVFQVERRGNDRVATIVKTRNEAFPLDVVMPFSYEEIAGRYGRDSLERGAVPVVLATKEQIYLFRELLANRKDGEELLEKALAKEDAESIDEMSSEFIGKCIAKLQGIAPPVTDAVEDKAVAAIGGQPPAKKSTEKKQQSEPALATA